MPHKHGGNKHGTTKNSGIFFAVEIVSAMPRNRLSRRVILRASITSVILISIMFIVTYTIILTYVDRHLPFELSSEIEQGYSSLYFNKGKKNKLKPKLYDKHRNENETMIMLTQTEVKWRVEDWDDLFADKPFCSREANILVIITSSPGHWDRRKAIRQTWCNPKNYNQTVHSWQCVFLVGQTSHSMTEILLESEMLSHNDILRGSYLDSYKNLTMKVLHGMYWSSHFCPTKYLLKTDDDCYVNIMLLLNLLSDHNTLKHGMYIGNIFRILEKRRVIRNPQNKWSVTTDEYPGEYYPPYASGTGYLLSQDIVMDIIKKGRYLSSFVSNEDAFIGMVVWYLGISAVHSSRFVLNSSGWRICNHLYLLVIHDVKPKQQYTMQESSLRANKTCKPSLVVTWD